MEIVDQEMIPSINQSINQSIKAYYLMWPKQQTAT